MMRIRLGALASLAAWALTIGFGSGEAGAAGPPCATCGGGSVGHPIAHGHSPGPHGHPIPHGHGEQDLWEDESPFYGPLAWWSFQKSQCKEPKPKHFGLFHGKAYTEPVYFPPLPYSPLVRGPAGPGQPVPPTGPAGTGTDAPPAPTIPDPKPEGARPAVAPTIDAPIAPAAPGGFPID